MSHRNSWLPISTPFMVFIGAIIGLASSLQTNIALAFALFVVVCILMYKAVRRPVLTICIFWILYTAEMTVLGGSFPQGLFYPIYLLMGFNLVKRFSRPAEITHPRPALIAYLAFAAVVVIGLLWQPRGVSYNTGQRLFIFCLGFLSAGQLRREQDRSLIYQTLAASAVFTSLWVLVAAYRSGFAYRGGSAINPHVLAVIIYLGTLPILVWLIWKGKISGVRRAIAWLLLGVNLYAGLVLASRGATMAVVAAMMAIILHSAKRVQLALRCLAILILVSAGVLLLPGANGFLSRFTESSIYSLTGRIPLWKAGIEHLSRAEWRSLLFGGGLGASEIVTRQVNYGLRSIHSVYLQFAIEYGLVGLALLLTLLVILLLQVWHRKNSTGAACTGILAFLAVSSVAAQEADTHIFWIALGTAIPLASSQRERATSVRTDSLTGSPEAPGK